MFDELRSGRPKWVGAYEHIEHTDGRSHTPPWVSSLFSGGGEEAIGGATFAERLQAAPYVPCLGPPKSVPKDEPPSEAACLALFRALSGGSGGLITAADMAQGLRRETGEEWGAMWRDFKEGFMK